MLEKWGRIHDMQKAVYGWPSWRLCPVSRPSNKSLQKLYSSLIQRQELLVSLCDGNGLNLQDAQVKIIAPSDGSQDDVTAIFQVSDYDWTTIARMDFWPSSPHGNPDWKELGLPRHIKGCHNHRFHLNAKIGLSRFKPKGGNIGNADVFPSPVTSFRNIFSLIENS